MHGCRLHARVVRLRKDWPKLRAIIESTRLTKAFCIIMLKSVIRNVRCNGSKIQHSVSCTQEYYSSNACAIRTYL